MVVQPEIKDTVPSTQAEDNSIKNVLVLITNQKEYSGGKKDYVN